MLIIFSSRDSSPTRMTGPRFSMIDQDAVLQSLNGSLWGGPCIFLPLTTDADAILVDMMADAADDEDDDED